MTSQIKRATRLFAARIGFAREASPPAEQPADASVPFSRSASPLGKLEAELKTKVDETTFELYRKQCAAQQTSAANDMRNCVYLRVYGKSYDQMVLEKMNHEAERSRALQSLIGHFGAPESEGGGHVRN